MGVLKGLLSIKEVDIWCIAILLYGNSCRFFWNMFQNWQF
jgi:hypothetical protein